MLLISRVASRGTTVLCSLHQPRPQVVRLLDKIILLSRGRVAFSGAPSEAEAFFASAGRPFLPLPAGEMATSWASGAGDVNPADAMLDAVGDAENAMDRARAEGGNGEVEASVEEGMGVREGGDFLVISPEIAIAQVSGGLMGRNAGWGRTVDFVL